MKIRIAAKGIFGAKGEIPVGTEFSIKGDVPKGWKGRVEIVNEDPAAKAQAVTNPAKSNKRKGLEKQAAAAGVAFNDETTDETLLAEIKAAKAQG